MSWGDVVAPVLMRAEAEWAQGVEDRAGTPGVARIDAYIRGPAGLGWPTVEVGPNARPKIPYRDDGDFAWCGAFTAFCWQAAGLDRKVRRDDFASTWRLWTWGRSADAAAKGRVFQRGGQGLVLLPGDVVIVKGPSKKPYGSHITLCVEPLPETSTYRTIEGNARGVLGPDGKRRGEGVVRNRRKVSDVAFTVRPGPGDLARAVA